MTALLDMWSTVVSLVQLLRSPGICLEDRNLFFFPPLSTVNNNHVKYQVIIQLLILEPIIPYLRLLQE